MRRSAALVAVAAVVFVVGVQSVIDTTADTSSAGSTPSTTSGSVASGRDITTTRIAPTTTSRIPVELEISESTSLTTSDLGPGDSIVFSHGATLTIDGSVDWQGTADDPIVISGEGDIMFVPPGGPSTLRHMVVDLQPRPEVDHYPLHWHLVGDGSRGTVVEDVIVQNSTNRAFVPHGSHGITFKNVTARNIAGAAFWWNPPGSAECETRPRFCTADNSNDVVVDGLLVDGVTTLPGNDRGFRLAGVVLGAGSGNVIRNSTVLNVAPDQEKDCSAFRWPESANLNEGGMVWTFENNHGESSCHGIFVWQNGGGTHFVDGFSGGGIDHGAYTNGYVYRRVDVPYVEQHAVGTRFVDSKIGDVISREHQQSGEVHFVRVVVTGEVRVVDAEDGGSHAVDLVFIDSEVSCSQVVYENAVPGSRVLVDGDECPRP